MLWSKSPQFQRNASRVKGNPAFWIADTNSLHFNFPLSTVLHSRLGIKGLHIIPVLTQLSKFEVPLYKTVNSEELVISSPASSHTLSTLYYNYFYRSWKLGPLGTLRHLIQSTIQLLEWSGSMLTITKDVCICTSR